MKKITLLSLLMISVLLTGCNQEKESHIIDSSTNRHGEVSSVEEVVNETNEFKTENSQQKIKSDVPWNQEKDQELNTFMDSWGKTMNQTYKQYSPNNNVDLYGLKLPDKVLDNKNGWQAVVDDVPIKIQWSENGEGAIDYSLVAVYSDADTQPYLEKHVYFFTFVSGIPKVLMTKQNQGNENNYLYFKETENKELKDGFLEIVSGNKNYITDANNQNEFNLGTIAYKDLNTNDYIQGKAQWMGCSIEDDGTTINLIPAMSATIQNIQLYISGQGDTDYYNKFLDAAKDISLKTGGKPVSIWSKGGDGEVIITTQNGAVVYSI